MDRERNLEMLAWLAGGVVLGAVVALLLAPDAGSRTRQKLIEQAGEGGRSLLGSSQDIIAKGRELFQQGRGIAEDTAKLLEKINQIAEKRVEDRF
ncbi:MAG: YtxH domain-containing protein [Acidobacteriaceae bacterium]|nr:YtxH domain-containing protein [Acidobacteriaceae bacterium]